MIREQQLSLRQIARLFACSASRDRGHVVAVVLIAGATARFNACRDGFNGDIERALAEQALAVDGDVADAFAKVSQEAAAIVGKHWREIAAA
jgi:hypothetical protein